VEKHLYMLILEKSVILETLLTVNMASVPMFVKMPSVAMEKYVQKATVQLDQQDTKKSVISAQQIMEMIKNVSLTVNSTNVTTDISGAEKSVKITTPTIMIPV